MEHDQQHTSSETDTPNSTDNTKQGNTIIACLDGASLSQAVCDYGIWLAKTFNRPLCLVHVNEPGASDTSDLSGAIGLGAASDLLTELASLEKDRAKLIRKQGQLMLEAAKQRALDQGVAAVEIEQRLGYLSEYLIAKEQTTAFVVVGIRGAAHEQQNAGVGAQVEQLIRSVRRPILVVTGAFDAPKRCLFAYDGSPPCERALEMVSQYDAFAQFSWTVVHAVEDQNVTADFKRAQQRLSQAGFTQVDYHATHGRPSDALVGCQEQYATDLMVMGAFSHHPLRGFFFGSLTGTVLQSTCKPLLLLH